MIRPLGGNVLVELDPQPEPPTNGIIRLDAVLEKSRVISGVVRGIGDWVYHRDVFKVGDRVRLSCYVGERVEIDGRPHQILCARDLYAIDEA